MKNLIKFLLLVSLLLTPFLASAQTFESNLYFGLRNNPDVEKLQEFLTDQGVYSGPITRNFFSLTLAAVKKFQSQNNIFPVAGFFGPLTRTKTNEILSVQLGASNQRAVTETGAVAPSVTQNSTTNNVQQLMQSLQAQILALQQQLVQMQQQDQLVQNQQSQIQSQQTQIQNQQNQISSIQQQVNQPTQNNQTVSNPPVNNIVQQPTIPALKSAYGEGHWSVGKIYASELDLQNWNYYAEKQTENKNGGIPTSIAIQNRDNDSSYKIWMPSIKWRLEFNGQTVLEKSNTIMFNVNVYESGNLKLKPETNYSYTIYYEETGRERSEYSGTFKTGTKQWLEEHDFSVE